MDHIELIHNAKTAIDKVFSDDSISKEETLESLEEIADELESYIVTLENEIGK